MGRGLMRHEFWMHNCMAQLTAEFSRIGVFVSTIAADRADQDENNYKSQESSDRAPLLGIVQIQQWELDCSEVRPAPSFDQHSDRNQREAQDEESRENHISEHPYVWARLGRRYIDEEQENYIRQRYNRERKSCQAYVIS
jgi:hypothetical protein